MSDEIAIGGKCPHGIEFGQCRKCKAQSELAAPTGSAKDPIRKKGVLIPADNTFEAVNRFVHSSPEYEELQWAMLGLAKAHELTDKTKQQRAIELLDVIVRPGDHDFYWAITEAQTLLGYEVHHAKPRRARSFYGIHSPNDQAHPTAAKASVDGTESL